jgi:hypothetical protein
MSVKTGQNADPSDINNINHFVAGESISSGDAVSLNYSDYKVYKASASAFDHRLNFVGFAMAAATLNNPVQVNVLTVVNEKTGLTANTTYYLSNTQGAIGTSAGTYERIIGRSVSTTKLIRKRGIVTATPITLAAETTHTIPTNVQVLMDGSNGGTSDNQFVFNGIVYHNDKTGTFLLGPGMTFQNDSPVGARTDAYILDFAGFY